MSGGSRRENKQDTTYRGSFDAQIEADGPNHSWTVIFFKIDYKTSLDCIWPLICLLLIIFY